MADSSHSILIFGGSFDPPHLAHVRLPELAARELNCARALYVPAARSPLKEAAAAAPANDRLAMLRLALAGAPWAAISTIELERGGEGPSYTIDTLRALRGEEATKRGSDEATNGEPGVGRRDLPKAHLLIGADQALDFQRWHEWREILQLARPAVMLRPPWTRETFHAALDERYGREQGRQWLDWTLRTLPRLDITATEVRRRLAMGEPVDDLMAPAVLEYIRRHGLYGVRPR